MTTRDDVWQWSDGVNPKASRKSWERFSARGFVDDDITNMRTLILVVHGEF